ncbi:MAG TPA: chemotaxis protein CheW [Pyrinomonadaceae bacterium]|nr:chemotaxis protein CheW [Pyrinomonadaceae bacterium]
MRENAIGFRLVSTGVQTLALPADEIESVSDWRQPTPLPNAPAGVLGVILIRGRVLTVLDSGALLGGTPSAKVKIVALRGDEQIALAVGQVDEVAVESAMEDLPNSERAPILGQLKNGDRSIPVLDVKQLFATAMRGHERRKRHF